MENYHERLRQASANIPVGAFQLFPTTFGSDGLHTTVFPRDPSRRWAMLESALTDVDRPVLAALPSLWQLGNVVHEACRRHTVAPFFVVPFNYAVAHAAIENLGIETVIISKEAIDGLARHMEARSGHVPATWVCVGSLTNVRVPLPEFVTASAQAIYQEIHLFPGVPIFTQCEALAHQKGPSFHATSGLELQIADDATYITSREEYVPFVNLEIPVRLADESECTCSRKAYTISPCT